MGITNVHVQVKAYYHLKMLGPHICSSMTRGGTGVEVELKNSNSLSEAGFCYHLFILFLPSMLKALKARSFTYGV